MLKFLGFQINQLEIPGITSVRQKILLKLLPKMKSNLIIVDNEK